MKPARQASVQQPEATRRAGRRRGLFVAILGADGSGKTTLAGDLRESLAPLFTGTALFHVRPNLIVPRGPERAGRFLDYFVENTFNYPTLAEAYKIAALDAWNRMPRTQPSKAKLAALTEAIEAKRA